MTTGHSVGGAARPGTPGSAGSSPAVPTTLLRLSTRELRHRIRLIDKRLGTMRNRFYSGGHGFNQCWHDTWRKLDEKRRVYRLAIKAKGALRARARLEEP